MSCSGAAAAPPPPPHKPPGRRPHKPRPQPPENRARLDELHALNVGPCQLGHMIQHAHVAVAEVVDHGDPVPVLQQDEHGVAACSGAGWGVGAADQCWGLAPGGRGLSSAALPGMAACLATASRQAVPTGCGAANGLLSARGRRPLGLGAHGGGLWGVACLRSARRARAWARPAGDAPMKPRPPVTNTWPTSMRCAPMSASCASWTGESWSGAGSQAPNCSRYQGWSGPSV